MAILEVQDIHTYYGDAYVLQGLSLKLEEGQILGLLGRNGVGKTTLVNSIVGFNRPRRGLMTNPDCLIMDESSEGLAPIIIQGLWQAIARLKEEGHSILLVEQNASLALQLVDYVHVMSKGQVVYSARPEELRANDEIK